MRKSLFYILILFFLSFALNLYSAHDYEYVQNEPSWVIIGRAKRLIGLSNEEGKALKLLQDVIAYDKTNAEAHYLLGKIYQRQGSERSTNEALLKIAVVHYKAAIKYAKNLKVPAYETESYFNLLECYRDLMKEYEKNMTIIAIERLASRKSDKRIKGRLYFELGEYYKTLKNYIKALEYYQKAFESEYRMKISLYMRARIERILENYTKEKRLLLHAERYEFGHQSSENVLINKYIKDRLKKLESISLPKAYKTPSPRR